MSKEIFLLRHGDTGKNGCYIGSTDVPLSPLGLQQVRSTARALRTKNVTKVFCSPMLRCRQTWAELDMSIPGQVNDLLKEVDFGRWEGKTFAEIAASDAEAVTEWTKDPENFCFPGGDCLASFNKRLTAVMTMLEDQCCSHILVVTHGGVIRHLLCRYLKIPSAKYLAFDVQPGCYSSIRLHSDGGVLTGFNLGGMRPWQN